MGRQECKSVTAAERRWKGDPKSSDHDRADRILSEWNVANAKDLRAIASRQI
jgi:hypothetical protein